MNGNFTAEDVARWMFDELTRTELLYQEVAVYSIHERFGQRFTFLNDNGNLAIAPAVLKAFRKLTEETVVWQRGERCWRKRRDYDRPGREQD